MAQVACLAHSHAKPCTACGKLSVHLEPWEQRARGRVWELSPSVGYMSVVFLVTDRSPIPTQTLQQLAVRFDHLVETADVGVHVGTGSNDFGQMFLHVSSQPFPLWIGAAQRGKEMKLGMVGGEPFKLLAIINVLLAARAEEQPELASLMAVALGQQPMQHGAERRNPGSSGDEHGVAQRRAQNEITERPLKRNLRAFGEAAEMVRHKSILHAIQAEGDMPVLGRRGRDRIRASHLLSVGSRGLH